MFLKKPKMYCDGCGMSMAKVKNVWKDKSKEYCGRSCLESDRIVRAAGFQTPIFIGIAAILAVFMVTFAVVPKARAQEHKHHSQFHKDFYQEWKVPGKPNESCCNARVEKEGVETGDCEPTDAEVRNGQWWVWVRQIYEWIPVDDKKIVRYPNPNIFDAHHCWTPQKGTICFKPPDTGG